MKKLVIVVFVSMLLVGCSSTSKVEEITKEEILEKESASYSFLYAKTTTKLVPTNVNGSYTFYEPKSDGYVYLDLVMEFENSDTQDLNLRDLSGKFTIDKKSADVQFIVESDNFSELDSYYAIKPNESVRLHAIAEVSDSISKEDEVKFDFSNKTKNLDSYSFKLDKLEEPIEKKALGDTLSVVNLFDIKIENTSIMNKLEPSVPGKYYTSYYENKSSDISNWYVISWTVTNTSLNEIDIDDYLSVKAIADGQYEYSSGSAYIESADGTEIDSRYEKIKPQEVRKMYSIVEIPSSVSGKSVDFIVATKGVKYQVKFVD